MKTNRSMLAIAASVIVGALVIAGLFAVGSPGTARNFRLDQRRIDQLQQLHTALVNHLVDRRELPETLEELEPAYWENYGQPVDPRRDPGTNELFEYRSLGDRRYEVCAEFETSSSDRRNVEGPFRPRPFPIDRPTGESFFEHEPGRNCFSRTITNLEIRDIFPPDPRFPAEVVSPVAPPSPPPGSSPSPTG